MHNIGEKLLIGDYYSYFTYPIRQQIIRLFKNNEVDALAQLLDRLIHTTERPNLGVETHVISIFDPLYPALLLECYDPPLILYAQGNIDLLGNDQKLAIVGARKPRIYSLQALEELIEAMVRVAFKPVLVSGLAKGIDGATHSLALKHNFPTIAVLGFGFNYMYPQSHKELAQTIRTQEGLLLSEYPPHIGVNRWQFVARNRIIASLVQTLVIIEAKEKSGSLITAELSLAENREVYVVSGQTFDTAYAGSHMLMAEGAKQLRHIDQLVREYTKK